MCLVIDSQVEIDDLALVAISSDSITTANSALETIHSLCTKYSLTLSSKKTKAIRFSRGVNKRNQTISLNNQVISLEKEHMYLGVILDQRLNFFKHRQYIDSRTRKQLNILRCLKGTNFACNQHTLLMYYTKCIRALLEYAAPAIGYTKDSHLTTFEIIQNLAIKTILGLGTLDTGLPAMRCELGLPTIEYRYKQLTHKFLCKTLDSPDDCSLKQHIIKAHSQKQHTAFSNGWTKHILDTLQGLPFESICNNTTPPHCSLPWKQPVLEINQLQLPGSKASMDKEELLSIANSFILNLTTENSVVYYTDGSLDPDTGRAAAAYHTTSHEQGVRISDNASTLQTELVAILLALQHANTNTPEKLIIFTDSLSSLETLRYPQDIHDNAALINDIHEAADKLHTEIILAWIPSHVGIPGNERADALASEAREMEKITLTVPKTSTQQYKEITQRAWAQYSQHLLTLTHTNPQLKWLHSISGLHPTSHSPTIPKKIQPQLNRLRLNLPIPYYQPKDKTISIATCQYCQEAPLTPTHHLSLCPATTLLRAQIYVQEDDPKSGTPEETTIQILRLATINPEPLLTFLSKKPYAYNTMDPDYNPSG